MTTSQELLRQVPQVDAVLRSAALQDARDLFGDEVTARLVRDEVDHARSEARRGNEPGDADAVAHAASKTAATMWESRLRRAINATGVVLHTNLGRAPLSKAATSAVVEASGYTPLEIELGSGARGSRAPLSGFLISALTGAEASHVVNNNAAALLLILTALAKGNEVIVSRGELIEIGGEFRLPSIMEASGATLIEVGTTNRTHARDYRSALSERTALLLAVHPSNYEVVGYTARPELQDLGAIAKEAGVPLVHDIGSGLLNSDGSTEPSASASLQTADLVCFSTDKLLGGPQGGVIAGRKDLVESCKRHPIARALRASKLTLAALEATLVQIAKGERTPVQDMLEMDIDFLRQRAADMAARIPHATVAEDTSVAGGGSMPGHTIHSPVVSIRTTNPRTIAEKLRANAIFVRVDDGRIVLDLRTVYPNDDSALLEAVRVALA
ncbi:MAG: L-seryl-tRNA(Sec) selenium transferase [Actinomycetota bacterium]